MSGAPGRNIGRRLLCAILALAVQGCSHEVVPTAAYRTPESIPAPRLLMAEPGCFGTLIQWVAPDADFEIVQGWYVYKQRPGGEIVRLTPAPSKQRSYIDHDEPEAGTYHYWATALSRGGIESLKSNKARFAIELGQLAPPDNLTAEALNPHLVLLKWHRGSLQISSGHNVYRDGQPYGHAGDPDMPAFLDGGALPGHTYRYTVTAVDCKGTESAPAPEVSVTTPPE